MLARWRSTPPPKIHTPASWACRTTARAASPTAGKSSAGTFIVPSSNEIRYRGILVTPLSQRPRFAVSTPISRSEADRRRKTVLVRGLDARRVGASVRGAAAEQPEERGHHEQGAGRGQQEAA